MATHKPTLVEGSSLDGRLFLARALVHAETSRRIPHDEVDILYQNIGAIAHQLILMKTSDLSDESTLRMHMQAAFMITSLGLEYGSNEDLDKAVRLLQTTRLIKFFQIGNTLMGKLLDRTRDLLEHAVISPPAREEEGILGATYTDLETEGIQSYTHAEHEFLKMLLNYRMTIRKLQVTIRETDAPRMLLHLDELKIVQQQLTYIEHRRDYVQTLPLDKVFTLDLPANFLSNPIEYLTIGLIANLLLYRQVDFHLDEETRRDFHQLVYAAGEIRESFRQQLLDWIARYLEEAQQPQPVKTYAVAYWDDCLRSEGRRSASE